MELRVQYRSQERGNYPASSAIMQLRKTSSIESGICVISCLLKFTKRKVDDQCRLNLETLRYAVLVI